MNSIWVFGKYLFLIMAFDLVEPGLVNISKRKRCVQYTFDNCNSGVRPFRNMTTSSDHQCMVECVRHQSCKSYHYTRLSRSCELLGGTPRCMGNSVVPDTVFVSVAKCTYTAPWRVQKPTQMASRWVTTNEPNSRTDLVKVVNPSQKLIPRYVCRKLMFGLYLPGWTTMKSRIHAVYDDHEYNCPESGSLEYLSFNHPRDFSWENFTVTSKIPSNALIGGYWHDRSSLYIVKYAINNIVCIGYFRSDINKTFLPCSTKGIQHPSTVEMLIYL